MKNKGEMSTYVMEENSTTYNILVQGLNLDLVRLLDPDANLQEDREQRSMLICTMSVQSANSSLRDTPQVRGPRFFRFKCKNFFNGQNL